MSYIKRFRNVAAASTVALGLGAGAANAIPVTNPDEAVLNLFGTAEHPTLGDTTDFTADLLVNLNAINVIPNSPNFLFSFDWLKEGSVTFDSGLFGSTSCDGAGAQLQESSTTFSLVHQNPLCTGNILGSEVELVQFAFNDLGVEFIQHPTGPVLALGELQQGINDGLVISGGVVCVSDPADLCIPLDITGASTTFFPATTENVSEPPGWTILGAGLLGFGLLPGRGGTPGPTVRLARAMGRRLEPFAGPVADVAGKGLFAYSDFADRMGLDSLEKATIGPALSAKFAANAAVDNIKSRMTKVSAGVTGAIASFRDRASDAVRSLAGPLFGRA